jgi:hypothetical protein
MSYRIRFVLLLFIAFAGCVAAFVFGIAALAIEPPSQCDLLTDHEGVCKDPSLLYGTIFIAAAVAAIVAIFLLFKPRNKA